MQILTRDDTEHDVQYVTLRDARAEIQEWQTNFEAEKERGDANARAWHLALAKLATLRSEHTALQARNAALYQAARHLIAAKGRHNTQLAYERLRDLMSEKSPDAGEKGKADE